MIGKKLKTVLGFLVSFAMLIGSIPVTVYAQDSVLVTEEKEYQFLNPLATVEPRVDTPLADRSKVTDILNGEGPRELRLGVAWYYKPLDAEPPYAIARMLKAKWEAEYPGLTVRLVIPDPAAAGIGSELPADPQYIPAVGHAWNNRPDVVYDTWASKVDAMVFGVGD